MGRLRCGREAWRKPAPPRPLPTHPGPFSRTQAPSHAPGPLPTHPGPLLNEFGEVIGVNTAIRANAAGIGFAIPIDTAEKAVRILAEGKKIPHAYRSVLRAPPHSVDVACSGCPGRPGHEASALGGSVHLGGAPPPLRRQRQHPGPPPASAKSHRQRAHGVARVASDTTLTPL